METTEPDREDLKRKAFFAPVAYERAEALLEYANRYSDDREWRDFLGMNSARKATRSSWEVI